jgi:hypothetical protein
MGLIPDTRPAVKSKGDGYEADTDQDMLVSEAENEGDSKSETPKIKTKPKVRDLIQAQRDDLAIPNLAQDDMEVSVTSFKWELKSTSCCLIRFVKST